MKTAFITMASVAALAFSASPAAAQTEGFRAEVHGGWDRVSNTGIEEDGILYGVGIGYDVRLGETAFVGVEANADLSNGDVCEADVFDDGDEACIAVRRDFSVGVRAGVNVAPNTAVYALAGYTNARFRFDYRRHKLCLVADNYYKLRFRLRAESYLQISAGLRLWKKL